MSPRDAAERSAGDRGAAGRRAVVLVDHGSRRPEANQVAEDLAAGLRARLPGARVEVAHLEIAYPTPGQAVERCVAEGASDVVLLPLFLAPGRHGAGDLERLAAEARARHPGVTVRSAGVLGAHPSLVDALLDRLGEVVGDDARGDAPPALASEAGDPRRSG